VLAARLDAVGSLNPALEQARLCPRCGAPAVIDFPRSLACPACGYRAYSNPKPVACVIPTDDDGRVWLLRRAFAPGAELWTFPGGFVELGESVEDAARRELDEEMRIEAELGGLVGVYSAPDDPVMLVVYSGRALGRPQTTPEALEVRAFAPDGIPWQALAFWSTGLALRDFLGGRAVVSATP